MVRPSGESGSATVLSLGLSGATLALGGILIGTLHLVSLAQQIQQVADLSALAASDIAIGVAPGIPCRVARAISQHHGVTLTSCELEGAQARVSVSATQWGVTIVRAARATPEPSDVWADETPSQ